jgi:hypothetical protein
LEPGLVESLATLNVGPTLAKLSRRLVVYDALRQGGYYHWDFQPLQEASERFMRTHTDLNDLEEDQRFTRSTLLPNRTNNLVDFCHAYIIFP